MRNGIVPHSTPPKPVEPKKQPTETVQQTLFGSVAKPVKNLKDEKEIAVDILTAFPLITKEAAVNLLRTYGSLNAVLAASKEELLAVEGMDEKSASAILSMMKWKWRDQK